MIHISRWKSFFIIEGILLIILLGLILLKSFNSNEYIIFLSIFILFSIITIPYFRIRKSEELMSPIIIVTSVNLLYFVIATISMILEGNTYVYGKYIKELIVKGNIYLSISFIFLYIGYFFTGNCKTKIKIKMTNDKIMRYILVSSGVLFGCFLLFIITNNLSLISFITLKNVNLNYDEILANSSPLNNYFWLSIISLIISPILMYEYSKKNKIKKITIIIIYILIFMINVSFGYRYRLMIMLIAPFFYFKLKNQKGISLREIIPIILIMFIVVGFVGSNRNSIKSGSGLTETSLADVSKSFSDNLEVNKAFYAMMDSFNSLNDYYYGETYAYLLIQPIPRNIWNNKPYPKIGEILTKITGNEYAAKSGFAYPMYGEIYANFGLIGMCIIMYLFGYILKKIWMFVINNRKNYIILATYSIFAPYLLQVISRGYMVQTIQEIIFLLIIPIILLIANKFK
ncbi:O-antigen polymerase [Clostridium perfringens]|uniref:O-antigen polymerase n=1 Tax=Clostridium perfringens TaxID=1502 RepID=UPI0032DB00B0